MQKIISGLFAALFLLTTSLWAGATCPSAFEDTTRENAVKSTMLRFWMHYEKEGQNIELHLQNFVDEGLEIVTFTGSRATSKNEVVEGIRKLPEGMRNSHQVQEFNTWTQDDGNFGLKAIVVYQFQIAEKVTSVKLQYDGVLLPAEKAGTDRPLIKTLKMTLLENLDRPEYLDVYRSNRMEAFFSYWYSLYDQIPPNFEKIRPLVADKFDLLVTGKPISTEEAFEEWVGSIPTRVSHASHHVRTVTSRDLGGNRHAFNVALVFQGMVAGTGALTEADVFIEGEVLDEPGALWPKIVTYRTKMAPRLPRK